jgi:hypothetical protein
VVITGCIVLVVGHQQRGDRARAAARLQHRAFGHVDELAHVAGPGRLQELRGLLRGDLGRVAAVFLGELVGNRVNSIRMSSPRAQRRQVIFIAASR